MIYFDQCSTSFPKAPGVSARVKDFIDGGCLNAGRGSYSAARAAEQLVYETRGLLAALFGFGKAKNVIFTGGATQSLNMILKGALKPGDHCVTTAAEHNSVLRPLAQLAKSGVSYDVAGCSPDGRLSISDLKNKINRNTKMIMATHASNVCGTVLPAGEIGRICEAEGIFFALDAAQTGGVIPLSISSLCADALVFSGHKGLLAAPGVGGFIISDRLLEITEPLISGGTGSFSHSADMPYLAPDKFEAGTLNLAGVAALNESVSFITERGVARLRENENGLFGYFADEIKKIPGVRLAGYDYNNEGAERCAVAALDFINTDNGEAAGILDEKYGIMTRSGLQCAPLMHKALGTFPRGVVRCSFGYKNTRAEVDFFLEALERL